MASDADLIRMNLACDVSRHETAMWVLFSVGCFAVVAVLVWIAAHS